jgi:hypothetical protein
MTQTPKRNFPRERRNQKPTTGPAHQSGDMAEGGSISDWHYCKRNHFADYAKAQPVALIILSH